MASPLDEISFELGKVSAGNAILLARMDKSETELAEMQETLTRVEQKLDTVIADNAFMKPHVTHYAGVRKRAAGLNSLIVGAVSLCGSAVTTWILKKYGG